MSAESDARDNETARQTRTERELARLEAQEQGRTTAAAKKKKKKKPAEKAGMGTKDTRTITKNIENIKEQLRNAGRTKDLSKARNLAGRLQALKEIRDSDA